MANIARLDDYRPRSEAVERKVADVEDGYTRIANELLESIASSDLTARQLKVMLAIIRKTYGFGKKTDRIADSQIAGITGLSRQNVNKAKNELILMNFLILDGNKIGVNKNISCWVNQSRDSVSNLKTKNVSNLETEDVSNPETHKRNTLKKKENKDKNILPEQVQAECKNPPPEPAKQDQIQSAFETIFWCAGMRKVGKPKALSSFKSQFKAWRKETGGTPEQFAEFLAADIRLRLQVKIFGFENLHPTTYLNGQRWTDEKPVTNTPTQSTTGQSGITVSESGLVFLD
ncbi:replication protein [Xenorhabdus bovienii]|uniref:replication protein n=1 Tax=Xenorhabdus bovienii TaxID=40576 RepID=UPI0023B28CEA|nr:replication protein [Xenorhabdus bovienii]MDE9467487.1 replication protein [Xenorhabdus bovienii]